MKPAFVDRWPEYLIEAFLLGCFMAVACTLVVVFNSPRLWIYAHLTSAFVRTAILASAIGVAAALLIHSPWGKRSGAHINPAVTIAFLFLKRISLVDAIVYSLSQTVGAIIGVLLVARAAGQLFTGPPITYAITAPGASGELIAFAAELVISFALMLVILYFVGSSTLIHYTGVAVGALITLFIIVEAPLSGTSMNPARTIASAFPSGQWAHVWIYLTAPTLGMLLAALAYRSFASPPTRVCAKLLHPSTVRCIHCGYEPMSQSKDSEGDG